MGYRLGNLVTAEAFFVRNARLGIGSKYLADKLVPDCKALDDDVGCIATFPHRHLVREWEVS